MTDWMDTSARILHDLPMTLLIGGPLYVPEQVKPAPLTADSMQTARQNKDEDIPETAGFSQEMNDPSGVVSERKVNVDVPLQPLAPVPALDIDQANVAFETEVRLSGTSMGGSQENGKSARWGD